MSVSDLYEVLAHHKVEESSRTSAFQVVILEVVPETGLDYVIVLDEVFKDILYVDEPLFELNKSWRLVTQVCGTFYVLKLFCMQL